MILAVKAMEALGLNDPAKCIVVEDGVVGLQGAKAAGMIAVIACSTGHKRVMIM